MILCRSFEVWKKSPNTRRNEPNKMAEAIGSQQRIHKLAKLSVFFVVRKSSFHRYSEGGNNNKKTKQNKWQVESLIVIVIFIIVFLWGVHSGGSIWGRPWTSPYSGLWTRSVGGSMDWGSVFSGHPSYNISVTQQRLSLMSLGYLWYVKGHYPLHFQVDN